MKWENMDVGVSYQIFCQYKAFELLYSESDLTRLLNLQLSLVVYYAEFLYPRVTDPQISLIYGFNCDIRCPSNVALST